MPHENLAIQLVDQDQVLATFEASQNQDCDPLYCGWSHEECSSATIKVGKNGKPINRKDWGIVKSGKYYMTEDPSGKKTFHKGVK